MFRVDDKYIISALIRIENAIKDFNESERTNLSAIMASNRDSHEVSESIIEISARCTESQLTDYLRMLIAERKIDKNVNDINCMAYNKRVKIDRDSDILNKLMDAGKSSQINMFLSTSMKMPKTEIKDRTENNGEGKSTLPDNTQRARKEDIEKVRELFTNYEQMMVLFGKLESQLQQSVGNLYDSETKRLASHYMQRQSHNDSHRHVLRKFCERWALEHGFNDGIVVKIQRFLSSKEFSSILKSGSLFKDNPFKGPSHGARSHIWQLWCMTQYAHENPGWISCSPVELMALPTSIDYNPHPLGNDQ